MDNCPYPDRSLEVRVADYMAEQGHTVHLVVERPPRYSGDQPKTLDVTVGPVVQIALNQIRPPVDFVQKLVGLDYDVIFCSSVSGAQLGHLLSKKKGVPWVVQVLDVPAYRFIIPQYREQWRQWLSYVREADHIVANTEVCRKILYDFFKPELPSLESPVPMSVVYYGVDHITAEKAVPLKASPEYISMVGRLVWDKGFELLFYAMEMRAESMPVRIVGNGPEAGRLIETAALCKVGVEFHGAASDPEKFAMIKGSRFGVYTDINTYKSGLFPLEALLCGKRCIAWDTPVNRERYQDYVEYVPYLDLRRLGEKVATYYQKPGPVDTPYEEGRRWVLENRTYKQHSEQLVKIFQQTVKK